MGRLAMQHTASQANTGDLCCGKLLVVALRLVTPHMLQQVPEARHGAGIKAWCWSSGVQPGSLPRRCVRQKASMLVAGGSKATAGGRVLMRSSWQCVAPRLACMVFSISSDLQWQSSSSLRSRHKALAGRSSCFRGPMDRPSASQFVQRAKESCGCDDLWWSWD